MKRRPTVVEIDRGWNRLRDTLAVLTNDKVRVKAGILGANAAAKVKSPDGSEEEFNVVRLAATHEFGATTSKGVRIPARSFVRAPFEKNKGEYIAMLRKFAEAVIFGKMTLDRAMALIGTKMASDMRNAIRTGIAPPNAQSTIDRKLRKGTKKGKPVSDAKRLKAYTNATAGIVGAPGDPKPLIDTGQNILNRITYQVVRR